MDTVTNVLGAYFHSGDGTAGDLVDAFLSAARGAPKTYRQIFDVVDPTQIIVVDGEQDNDFVPGMMPAPPGRPASTAPPSPPASTGQGRADASAPAASASVSPSTSAAPSTSESVAARGCTLSTGYANANGSNAALAAGAAIILLACGRRIGRASSCSGKNESTSTAPQT
jgi:hypothetical protein